MYEPVPMRGRQNLQSNEGRPSDAASNTVRLYGKTLQRSSALVVDYLAVA